MSTAQDLPGLYGEPLAAPVAPPALRLVPTTPLDFDDAVRRVRPRLHRYAIRRLGDSHEAEELVQEALLRAYTHREQLLTEDDLSAWATVVTGRLVIDRLRVRGRSTSVADVPEGARVGRDTAEVVVARDEARTALDALDAMPTRQASLLWAREVEGKSYEELCQQFDMTEPAVRSVLTRARKALRREYELRGGTVPVGGLAVLAPWIAGLSWADKLRKAANRLTAPAVLGAAGIAALGGLVLSPFGSDHHGTTSYRPAQAVVAATAAHSTPASRDLATARKNLTAGAAARGTSAHAASGSDAATATQTAVRAVAKTLGCTSAGQTGLVQRTQQQVQDSVGVGGSQCADGTHDISVPLPGQVSAVTGYDSLTVSNNFVGCPVLSSQLPSTTTKQTPQLVQCSETQR